MTKNHRQVDGPKTKGVFQYGKGGRGLVEKLGICQLRIRKKRPKVERDSWGECVTTKIRYRKKEHRTKELGKRHSRVGKSVESKGDERLLGKKGEKIH